MLNCRKMYFSILVPLIFLWNALIRTDSKTFCYPLTYWHLKIYQRSIKKHGVEAPLFQFIIICNISWRRLDRWFKQFEILLNFFDMWCFARFDTFVQFKKREVKLQASACNFTKSNTPPWVFFTFLKLSKLYQIAEIV